MKEEPVLPGTGGTGVGTGAARLRLRGDIGGKSRSFSLDAPEVSIGSAVKSRVRLREKGISRHHAVLRLEKGSWLLQDLDSKNGTYVNGRAVHTALVGEGDILRFGSIDLRLEAVDLGDEALGLELVHSREIRRSRELARSRADTSLLSPGGPLDQAGILPLLSHCLDRLAPPSCDLDGALDLIACELGAEAAALLEWRRGQAAVLLASSGTPRAVPKSSAIWDSGTDRAGAVETWCEAPPGAVGAMVGVGRHEVTGIYLWGDFPRRADCLPLMAVLVRLFSMLEQPPLADLGGSPVTRSRLVFPPGIVPGESRVMLKLYDQMAPLVENTVPVLIRGETGVGKEHLARTLHLSSPRAGGPFVALNCAAIPTELLEAELFGIGKGVATGVRERIGKFAEAEGGTLFLDEIGDMPATLQAKLLRALQEKEIHPLGERARSIDVRVVAATNSDMAIRLKDGRFREDLYYRIAGFVLQVPPLRERREDLPRLVGHFTRRSCAEADKRIRGFTVKALRLLSDYRWPGNVRQLEHEIRRLVYLCTFDQAIDSTMIAEEIADSALDAPAEAPGDETLDLETHVQELERRLIRRALRKAKGNQSRAAKLLGLSRNGLANRLKRLQLDIYETPSESG